MIVKEIKKTRAVRIEEDLFKMGRKRAISYGLSFSAYIEALILQDVSR